ncbi:TIGR01777 family oxidoreductase [bacterium]|nr:TIGR01777 family oxidoreductase [bacterium]
MAKTIGIIGASGWLGGHLTTALREFGYSVVGFSRSQRSGSHEWRVWNAKGDFDLSGIDAVINLAGEAIDQRWLDSTKKAFHESRVVLTEDLVKSMNKHQVPFLLNASAVGYYGDRGNDELLEAEPPAENYLAQLCVDWEVATAGANSKVCLLRTGVVLGKGGRAWVKMSKVFKLGVGGKLGSGKQWMPWIHLADEIGAILHCLEKEIEGAVNLVAPESVTNAAFTKAVGLEMNRPTVFAAPAFVLKLALGDFAEEGLLASQRVIPQVLLESGYQFQFPEISDALRDLCY